MYYLKVLSKLFPIESIAFFMRLVERLEPNVICDIGSRDGSQSILFREIAPDAKIHAFEANPRLAGLMRDNSKLQNSNVDIQNYAISNFDGISTFTVDSIDESLGNGSLRELVSSDPKNVYNVDTKRLANILSLEHSDKAILWIDVEGCGYEVVQGIEGIKDSVLAIHIEVETKEFWSGQKLHKDIVQLMDEFGFYDVIADLHSHGQGNVVFINKNLIQNKKFLIGRMILETFLFHFLAKMSNKLRIKSAFPALHRFAKSAIGGFLIRK